MCQIVFDGAVEGLHQNLKHRQPVTVIHGRKCFCKFKYTTIMLEKESGRVLILVYNLKKGHAVTIYQDKTYKCFLEFSENLLHN